MITRLLAVALVAASSFAFTILGTATVKIQTTAVCEMCKTRIEAGLADLDGVQSVRLDLTTKKVKIKFDDTKQSEASLRAAITQLGYAADGVTADRAAYEALPACCQNPDSCTMEEGQP